MMSVTTGCPDDNQLVAFSAGYMRGAEAAAIEGHMDRCSDCRMVLTELAHSDSVERTWADGTCDVGARTLPGDEYPAGITLADRFCLLRRLGTGGMGQVYEAEDTLLGIPVALKLLPPQVGASPRFVSHLRQEILLGRRVSHPNVCRIYDLGKSGDLHFLTMELVEGDTLAERLAHRPLRPEQARRIVEQIVAALAAAHREGVVHRDLKPGNIMVDRRDHVTVMDFGLARDDRWAHSGAPGQVGTPAYWAPEQALGEVATTASDVYALGLVMLETLSTTRDPDRAACSLSAIGRPLRSIIERCLAARPQDRFASAVEVESALARVARTRHRQRGRILSLTPLGVGIGITVLALCMISSPSSDDSARGPARTRAAYAESATPVRRARPPRGRSVGRERAPVAAPRPIDRGGAPAGH
jgi:eukaryotic-like serine/threonine-protein kinase